MKDLDQKENQQFDQKEDVEIQGNEENKQKVKISKKEKKRQKYESIRKIKKENHNKSLHNKRQKRKQQLQNMTHEQCLEVKETERMFKEDQLIKELAAFQKGIPLIFDLSFEDQMTEFELKSLTFQICQSVGIFRKCQIYPFKIILCSCTGSILQSLIKMGASKWNIHLKQESISEIPEIQQSCMLSPDAEETLPEDVKWDKYFIIGGIVDRTEKRFQTLNKAKSLNLPCYKIPLDIQITKKALNINTVVEMLFNKWKGLSWNEAILKAIPQRKIKY